MSQNSRASWLGLDEYNVLAPNPGTTQNAAYRQQLNFCVIRDAAGGTIISIGNAVTIEWLESIGTGKTTIFDYTSSSTSIEISNILNLEYLVGVEPNLTSTNEFVSIQGLSSSSVLEYLLSVDRSG